jgi:adenylate cyclase
MKRIMYVSTLVKSLTEEEISDIGRISSMHNRTIGVTGILLSAHEVFFQILEGRRSKLIGCSNKFVAIHATGT